MPVPSALPGPHPAALLAQVQARGNNPRTPGRAGVKQNTERPCRHVGRRRLRRGGSGVLLGDDRHGRGSEGKEPGAEQQVDRVRKGRAEYFVLSFSVNLKLILKTEPIKCKENTQEVGTCSSASLS